MAPCRPVSINGAEDATRHRQRKNISRVVVFPPVACNRCKRHGYTPFGESYQRLVQRFSRAGSSSIPPSRQPPTWQRQPRNSKRYHSKASRHPGGYTTSSSQMRPRFQDWGRGFPHCTGITVLPLIFLGGEYSAVSFFIQSFLKLFIVLCIRVLFLQVCLYARRGHQISL